MTIKKISAITALVANTKRLKRATDKLSPSVIIMVVLSGIGLIFFGIKF